MFHLNPKPRPPRYVGRDTDGQAVDDTEPLEISEGEEGQTEDAEATDAGYIEAAVDGEEPTA